MDILIRTIVVGVGLCLPWLYLPTIGLAQPPAAQKSENQQDRGDNRPTPDPTLLSTQALQREIAQLKELLQERIDGQDALIKLMQHYQDTQSSVLDDQVDNLQELQDEKFLSIEKQFKELDRRLDESAKNSKIAVDDALKAAKEAVSEQQKTNAQADGVKTTYTTKQIDSLTELAKQTTKSTDDKFADLKDRLVRAEGKSQGGDDSRSFMFAMIGVAGSIVAVVIGLASLAIRMQHKV